MITCKWKWMSFCRFLPVSENEENIYSSDLQRRFAIDVVIFCVIGKLSWMLLKAARRSKINAAL